MSIITIFLCSANDGCHLLKLFSSDEEQKPTHEEDLNINKIQRKSIFERIQEKQSGQDNDITNKKFISNAKEIKNKTALRYTDIVEKNRVEKDNLYYDFETILSDAADQMENNEDKENFEKNAQDIIILLRNINNILPIPLRNLIKISDLINAFLKLGDEEINEKIKEENNENIQNQNNFLLKLTLKQQINLILLLAYLNDSLTISEDGQEIVIDDVSIKKFSEMTSYGNLRKKTNALIEEIIKKKIESNDRLYNENLKNEEILYKERKESQKEKKKELEQQYKENKNRIKQEKEKNKGKYESYKKFMIDKEDKVLGKYMSLIIKDCFLSSSIILIDKYFKLCKDKMGEAFIQNSENVSNKCNLQTNNKCNTEDCSGYILEEEYKNDCNYNIEKFFNSGCIFKKLFKSTKKYKRIYDMKFSTISDLTSLLCDLPDFNKAFSRSEGQNEDGKEKYKITEEFWKKIDSYENLVKRVYENRKDNNDSYNFEKTLNDDNVFYDIIEKFFKRINIKYNDTDNNTDNDTDTHKQNLKKIKNLLDIFIQKITNETFSIVKDDLDKFEVTFDKSKHKENIISLHNTSLLNTEIELKDIFNDSINFNEIYSDKDYSSCDDEEI